MICSLKCPWSGKTEANKSPDYSKMKKADSASSGYTVLRNKAPRWHENLQGWCLNFHGRVTVASVKNVELVATMDQSQQGGKVTRKQFSNSEKWETKFSLWITDSHCRHCKRLHLPHQLRYKTGLRVICFPSCLCAPRSWCTHGCSDASFLFEKSWFVRNCMKYMLLLYDICTTV